MENLFITDIKIKKVRHLKELDIEICKDTKKNLIITGKNGSGKTSLLEAIWDSTKETTMSFIGSRKVRLFINNEVKLNCNIPINNSSPITSEQLHEEIKTGNFILEYFRADRTPQFEVYKGNKKPDDYTSKYFLTFMVDLKTQYLMDKGEGIENPETQIWFDKFEQILGKIFNDDTLKLMYDRKNYCFTIKIKDREPFGFDVLSDGYKSILNIVSEILMKMEKVNNKFYDIQGIVLIDEIETHLHLELQKSILPFLNAVFPNIQFIVTTHSPFIIASDENAVVYDLEFQKSIVDMTKYSYSAIVESYFKVDELSKKLRADFERYKHLIEKSNKDEVEISEISILENKLDEVPDFLNIDFAHEYTELKFKKDFE